MKCWVSILLIWLLPSLLFATPPRSDRDTVAALVVSSTDPIAEGIENMSGEEIIDLVDSLLDTKSIPYEMIKKINAYAENRLLHHDYYNSLTAFYDTSKYPAQSFYQRWDNYNIFHYDESIAANDTSVTLVLSDSISNCTYYHPLDTTIITSYFGFRNGKNHHGIDFDLQVWDPVRASFDGMVRLARYHEGYGRVVIVRHYNGLETLYAHLHRFKVKVGDVVEAGQIIGLGGSSGQSSGSHLHFEMRFKGKPLNPKHIINLKKEQLFNDTLILKRSGYTYLAIPKGQKFHTIQRGDFMYKIAKRYGMTVNQLCELNGCSRNKRLIVGRKLRISN